MKRFLAFVLIAAFATGAVGCTGTVQNMEASGEIAVVEEKSEAVLAAEKAINAIGEVTLESEDLIIEAEKRYDFLTDAEKVTVSNRMTLFDARSAYEKLVKDKQESAEKRANEIAAAFFIDYDVAKAIASYQALLDEADNTQKEMIKEQIRMLEAGCFPGTHFLTYKALAAAKYTTDSGFTFEMDGDAYIFRNNEKGVYRKTYWFKCDDCKQDPIFQNSTFQSLNQTITGEYYGYVSADNYKDSTVEQAGIVPYWMYLNSHFDCREITPDWGYNVNGRYESVKVYTDDQGNQLYTKSFSMRGYNDIYFCLKRAH